MHPQGGLVALAVFDEVGVRPGDFQIVHRDRSVEQHPPAADHDCTTLAVLQQLRTAQMAKQQSGAGEATGRDKGALIFRLGSSVAL